MSFNFCLHYSVCWIVVSTGSLTWPRLVLNQRSSCLRLPTAGILSTSLHAYSKYLISSVIHQLHTSDHSPVLILLQDSVNLHSTQSQAAESPPGRLSSLGSTAPHSVTSLSGSSSVSSPSAKLLNVSLCHSLVLPLLSANVFLKLQSS